MTDKIKLERGVATRQGVNDNIGRGEAPKMAPSGGASQKKVKKIVIHLKIGIGAIST